MSVDASTLKAMVERELAQLGDARVIAQIQALRVKPVATLRDWNYGHKDERYPCWTVLRHPPSNTGIAYCEEGFGPRSPWGLLFLEGDSNQTSIGMDCSWYTTFLQAYFESQAVSDLPIWRVFKTEGRDGERLAISDEGGWDATWKKVLALRVSDPANRYDCSTSIAYERE